MNCTSVCAHCSMTFTYEFVERAGRGGKTGRRRKYCSADCQREVINAKARERYNSLSREERRQYNLEQRRLTCALCGDPMFRSPTSKPQGQAMHNACSKQVSQLRCSLLHLARVLERAKNPPDAQVKPKPKLKTTERGYGHQHRMMRMKLLENLIPGSPCAFCGQPMYSEQALDLDHSDPASRLRGEPGDRLTHSVCNRREGAQRRHGDRCGRKADCVICGDEFPYHRFERGQRTCGRVCGAEFRRQNMAARAA